MSKIDFDSFINLPYYKQLHICVLCWLDNQHIEPFVGGKPVRQYFICRTYLSKLDRQSVKNIALMLDETHDAVPLYSLKRNADAFVRRSYSHASSNETLKEYEIDLAAFLGR